MSGLGEEYLRLYLRHAQDDIESHPHISFEDGVSITTHRGGVGSTTIEGVATYRNKNGEKRRAKLHAMLDHKGNMYSRGFSLIDV